MALNPGPAVRYGDLTVNGSQAVDHAFIRAIADLPKGAPFHPDDVVAAQRRLVKLDTFRTVDVEPAENLIRLHYADMLRDLDGAVARIAAMSAFRIRPNWWPNW